MWQCAVGCQYCMADLETQAVYLYGASGPLERPVELADIHLSRASCGGHLSQAHLEALRIKLGLRSQLEPCHLPHAWQRGQAQCHLTIVELQVFHYDAKGQPEARCRLPRLFGLTGLCGCEGTANIH